MLPRALTLCVSVLIAVATPVRPQHIGPQPGRVLFSRQVSWWAADGLPASEVVARETTFVFRPDSARGWPSTGMVPRRSSSTPARACS